MKRKTNILDRIGSLIPGYRGYAERDGRRNCDKQLRSILSSKLFECETILVNQINEAIINSNKPLMRKIEICRKSINTSHSKVNYAPYGESGFFSDQQINEDELMRIYQFDLDMAEVVGEVENVIIDHDIEIIMKKLSELDNVLKNRNQFIREHM
jgi:hypothetical protein|tara:strand:+ start:388 stop:852 length:465 start_codon:yes stop_codon:yes gene_type:complete